MIGHKAARPDFCPGLQCRLAQKIKVQRVVSFIKEDSAVPVSTLGDMVGVAHIITQVLVEHRLSKSSLSFKHESKILAAL
uniref:Uncharacterized protein n=1 Tax=Candidatus Kentrum sp. DK TaxID=2126562 RepID=A0A450TNA3_9GAMM|nr:MAG: hypothetical protein BECKDK2373B_GA0170837_12386 [Candidatus Kentron sp. DK]